MFVKPDRVFCLKGRKLDQRDVSFAWLRNGLVVVGVNFFLSAFKDFTVNVFVDWDAAFLVDRPGEIVTLSVVIAIAKAAVDFNPTICGRKEGGRIDCDDS